jgi:hypothetical protein
MSESFIYCQNIDYAFITSNAENYILQTWKQFCGQISRWWVGKEPFWGKEENLEMVATLLKLDSDNEKLNNRQILRNIIKKFKK